MILHPQEISHIWVQPGICGFFPGVYLLFWKARIVVTHAGFVTENLHKPVVMFLSMYEACKFFYCDSRAPGPTWFCLCKFQTTVQTWSLCVQHFSSADYVFLHAPISLPQTPLHKWFISDAEHSFISKRVIVRIFWFKISSFLPQIYYFLPICFSWYWWDQNWCDANTAFFVYLFFFHRPQYFKALLRHPLDWDCFQFVALITWSKSQNLLI